MNMNTTAHTLISSTIGLALGLFTFASALFAGPGSTATITGISLFVAFGLIEIMIQSYARPAGVFAGPRRAPAKAAAPSEVVPFTPRDHARKAA